MPHPLTARAMTRALEAGSVARSGVHVFNAVPAYYFGTLAERGRERERERESTSARLVEQDLREDKRRVSKAVCSRCGLINACPSFSVFLGP